MSSITFGFPSGLLSCLLTCSYVLIPQRVHKTSKSCHLFLKEKSINKNVEPVGLNTSQNDIKKKAWEQCLETGKTTLENKQEVQLLHFRAAQPRRCANALDWYNSGGTQKGTCGYLEIFKIQKTLRACGQHTGLRIH